MIVTARIIAVMRWPSASHQPASTNQMTLPTNDAAPALWRGTTVRPNGHSTYPASRKDAIPNGIVMIRTNMIRPANA